jgi:RNA-directed DNA polymerase
MGAFFLGDLDEQLARRGLFSVRFMDDVVVLAPTRWALRRSVSLVNRTLTTLGLEKHPHKTLIGCVQRGFDFLLSLAQ